MLPLRDNIPARSFPLVNWALIVFSTLVFIYETRLEPSVLNNYALMYGVVPANLSLVQPSTWIPLVTAIFLHGGWLHLISNMWVLFIFGDNVEDRMGHSRYLVFFILGGAFANILQALVIPKSLIPAIGASGSVAAVLGGYFFLFPRARVVTLIPIFLYPWIVEISAFIFLGFWFILQLYSGFQSMSMPGGSSMGGIAWWAHIGGFIFGLLAVLFFARRPAPKTDIDRQWPPLN